MWIQKMFERDINRYINGVISVGEEKAIRQELEEYVVTCELQRHFGDFFSAYEKGLNDPARNTGVWIQGYFGSGKSHFLKMLGYILENKIVDGKCAADYFQGKFDDPMTYARIKRATEAAAETILFNIDEKGGCYKEGDTAETAVLRSFARVFYEHLGFYGRDYKLARFEKMIDDRGKTNEFRAAYEDITGTSWLETRDSYDMYGEEVAEAANRAVGLSEKSITDWADSTDNIVVDIGELVCDINQYAAKREAERGGQFRLVFMVDEMGQYLNGNTSRMLNLQTIMEKFCDDCNGRVWMVVTSQEAIDEMMNVVSMDFSKIQGRFATRLSLSSSSVDEVIKERILLKNEEADKLLQNTYQRESAVLKNLFSFQDSRGDLKGFANAPDFVECFPFVGYQFTIMPSVLKEIRKHGYQGKSLSTGERSMISCFHEAAQKVEEGDELSLVPFWRFYDTLEKELDHGIKQVFERCRKAASNDYALKQDDVNVLKALYLINYISDIKPTVGNIAILLVDQMDVDMKALKDEVKDSLDRLTRENYVARNGERYSFLTDIEQEVAREIREEKVDPSSVIEDIKKIIFDKIYTDKRFRKGANDFPVDRYVDDTIHGIAQSGMRLNVITLANTELSEAAEGQLNLKSADQALLVLDTNDYYDVLYNAAKITKYVRTKNVSTLPQVKQSIILAKNEEAAVNRKEAEALIAEAIVRGRVSVAGKTIQVTAASAKQKIEGVLDQLAGAIFTKAMMIDAPLENDGQLRNILTGKAQDGLDGIGGGNQAAADEMDMFLESQSRLHQPVSMGDIQRHFQARPYGWREIDIAGVAAKLLFEQRAQLTYGGVQVAASDTKMRDYLRKQGEIDKATIKKREKIPAAIINKAKNLLREIDSSASVPSDEDGLVRSVKTCLEERIDRYQTLIGQKYRSGKPYPGREVIDDTVHLAHVVLGQQVDSESFLREFGKNEDAFLDNAEDLEAVERFFNSNQKEIFDKAFSVQEKMRGESAYVDGDSDVLDALAKIAEIVELKKPYDRIKDLPDQIAKASGSYENLMAAKHNDILAKLDVVLADIKQYAKDTGKPAEVEVKNIVALADESYVSKREAIHAAETCTKLDSIGAQLEAWRNTQLSKIDHAVAEASKPATPVAPAKENPPIQPAPSKTKVIQRSAVMPTKALHNEAEVDEYVAQFKAALMEALLGNDSIRLS